jgi:predicted component of type VI protein secretion system
MSFLNRFLPDEPQDDTLESVVRNLEYLLNSRGGYGSILCPFGLVDWMGEHGGQNAARTLLKEIEHNINMYEPRLRVLNLKVVGRDPSLTWMIELDAALLVPYWGVACRLLILFQPMTSAVQVEVLSGP